MFGNCMVRAPSEVWSVEALSTMSNSTAKFFGGVTRSIASIVCCNEAARLQVQMMIETFTRQRWLAFGSAHARWPDDNSVPSFHRRARRYKSRELARALCAPVLCGGKDSPGGQKRRRQIALVSAAEQECRHCRRPFVQPCRRRNCRSLPVPRTSLRGRRWENFPTSLAARRYRCGGTRP